MLTSRKLYETAYGALMPELTLDYDERTKLSTFRKLFGTVGDISGALLPFAASYLFARGTDFKVTGAIAALVVAGGAMVAYTGLRERAEFSTLERSKLCASIKSIAGNRPFVILLIATTLAVMAINIPTVLIRFLAKYWYHDENAAARWLIAYFAGSVISYPFWFRITVRIRKEAGLRGRDDLQRDVLAAFMVVTPAMHVAIYLLMAFTRLLGDRNLGHANLGVGRRDRMGRRAHRPAPGGRVRRNHLDVDQAGGRGDAADGRPGDELGRLQAGRRRITPPAGENLRALFALCPAAIYLLSALVFSRYPITRESHRAMRDRLAARSAAAEAEKSKAIA